MMALWTNPQGSRFADFFVCKIRQPAQETLAGGIRGIKQERGVGRSVESTLCKWGSAQEIPGSAESHGR